MTTTYPKEIYTACAVMADDLDTDLWEDEEDGKRIFTLGGNRRLSPAHCYDELQAMLAATITTSEPKTVAEVEALVETLEAKRGGAWVWSAVFGEVRINRYENRSSIPDAHCGTFTLGTDKSRSVRYQGRWMPYTDGQIIREQNRCTANV